MEECYKNENTFIDKMVELFFENKIDNSKTNDTVKDAITEWVKNGKNSDIVDSFFIVKNRQVPIWWSGFWIENPDKAKNPITDMKDAASKINGFSSLDTYLGNLLDYQNNFWNTCSYDKDFRWGEYLSKTYSLVSLRSNPTKIALFVNKKSNDFIKSYFYSTELDLINDHYEKQKINTVLHIYNIEGNCDDITRLIKEKFVNNNYITIICHGPCSSLLECVSKNVDGLSKNVDGLSKNVGGVRKNKKTKKSRKSKKRKSIKKRKI